MNHSEQPTMSDSKTYHCIVHPSHNRVYATHAPTLLAAELAIWSQRWRGQPLDVEPTTHAGIPTCTFTCPELTSADLNSLGNLAGLFATFQDTTTGTETAWRPLTTGSLDCLDSDVLTIQKYVGKTNEQFTKTLLNVTAYSTHNPHDFETRPLRVLDPMCGRGTTLNQAAMYGFDAYGIDLDKKAIEQHRMFFTRWLKDKRYKHRTEKSTLRHQGHTNNRHDVIYATDKADYRNDNVRTLSTIHADTHAVDQHFKNNWFDIIVTDTPYGIQHGSHHTETKQRSPQELIETAAPHWASVLRPGGALGVAINTVMCPREEVEELLEDAGLSICTGGGYEQFAHPVDRVITRDIVVATKSKRA